MASTSLHDVSVYKSLSRLHTAYNGLLAIHTRSLQELTPAEVELETQWQKALEPVLTDLYWYPLRNGLDQAPEDETKLRKWIKDALAAGVAVAALLALLKRYLVRGVNIGGRMALDLLGVGGAFHLADSRYLARLDDHATMLTTPDSDMSLIDTTIDQLARGIPEARKSDGNSLLIIGGMIAGWAAYRSVNIAVTEETRMVGNGLNWAYVENGLDRQVFTTRADDKVCPLCAPLDGRVMLVDNVPPELSLPIHPGCRCIYTPRLNGWQQPEQIWRGG